MTPTHILKTVRDHCTQRYNERYGYSAVVECFTDDELSELLEHTDDEATAMRLVEEYVDVVSSVYDDVRGA